MTGSCVGSSWVNKNACFLTSWSSNISKFVYTALLFLINISARFATNLFPPEQQAEIMADSKDVHDRIIGSKIVIPLEQCMLLSTWGVKTCLLIFLYRMTWVSQLQLLILPVTCMLTVSDAKCQRREYSYTCSQDTLRWVMFWLWYAITQFYVDHSVNTGPCQSRIRNVPRTAHTPRSRCLSISPPT